MAYTRQYTEDVGWQNTPSVATPINATNLNKMDDAIGNIDAAVYSEFIEAERIATSSNVGRVKPDNTTISVDGNGVISVVNGLPEIPLSIAHGGTGNSAGYIRTGNAAGVVGNKATIEGYYNAGVGAYCHIEGSYNEASANASNSHVGGTHNSSQYENQTVIGKYNANSSDNLFEIGNGVSGSRSNAFAVNTNGDASVGRNMTVAGDLTVVGDIIGGTDDIFVKTTNSSGTVSALSIGSFTPVNDTILIIHVLNNVSTSETTWIVQMGMVSYGILNQDGSYYTDDLTAGQYLMLITDTSNSRFILLSSGTGSDVPIATTSVAGKVKPDGGTILVDENGRVSASRDALQNVKVFSITQSGTISSITISAMPSTDDIYILKFANNVNTSQACWYVSFGMEAYPIKKQDGSNFNDPISAGTYLQLIVGSSKFVLLESGGGGGDVPIATTQVAGKVKPDGTSITVDQDGTIHSTGGGGSSSISCGYFSASGNDVTFHPMSEQVEATPFLTAADPTKVTASSEYNAGYAAWYTLDHNISTYWVAEYATSYPVENWIKIVLDSPIIPTMFYWLGTPDTDVEAPSLITVKNFDTDETLFEFIPATKDEERFVWRNPGTTPVSTIKVIYTQTGKCSGAREIKIFGLPVNV